MSPPELLSELRMAQDLVSALAEDIDDATFRQQYHPDLSPLGWHLGHCTFIECYWLQEVIQGDDRFTAPVADLYTPPRTPKPERGKRLPPYAALIEWVRTLQSLNIDGLSNPPPSVRNHPLMKDDRLVHFLIQHYSLHYETMLMVLTRRALLNDTGEFRVHTPLTPRPVKPDSCDIPAGHYKVGGQAPTACDNALPVQLASLGPCSISRQPVSNGEYLAFMDDAGYENRALWSDAGWQWRQQAGANSPEHWRRNGKDQWYGIGNRGPYALTGDDVLHGVSWYEAQAVAKWANARLPHEHQWEVACRLHQLEQTGRAWEWCDNAFYPYEGFKPFPYDEYSTPWFDNNHYTLRGGSLHTRPAIRRASFRNFYSPDKRHVFAGLRLVFDPDFKA